MSSQLPLFDPDDCIAHGAEFNDLLFTQILPGYGQQEKAEQLTVGGLSKALTLVGDQRDHPDLLQLTAAIRKTGRSPDQALSLVPAYRYASDPRTAGAVAHLTALTQVQGYLSQRAIGDEVEGPPPLLPSTPNRAAGPIDFDNLGEGGRISPNVAGAIGEDFVTQVLTRHGIEHQHHWTAPWIGWGKKAQSVVDFRVAAFDQEPLERGFYIESKWRNRPQSTDDDLTALLHNIEAWYDLPTLILYDGEGTVSDAYERVKFQLKRKNRSLRGKVLGDRVLTLSEFVQWVHRQLGSQRQEVAA